MKSKKDTPFFVGYLDMPAALKRFYWPLGILMMVGSLLAGYTLASAQKSTPAASWDTSQVEVIQGFLQVDPYPVLHRIDPDNPNQIQSILLVKQGKFSADSAGLPFHNKLVTVSGFPIRHGGWTMLEIAADSDIQMDSAAEPSTAERLATQVAPVSLGSVSLSGEIIDSKCYLGVMKPGEGPVHRACAEVCLIGGMPTMLVVRGHDNLRYGYLLTHSEGASVSPEYAAKAAKNHQVAGELMRKGDLLYIRLNDGASNAGTVSPEAMHSTARDFNS